MKESLNGDEDGTDVRNIFGGWVIAGSELSGVGEGVPIAVRLCYEVGHGGLEAVEVLLKPSTQPSSDGRPRPDV